MRLADRFSHLRAPFIYATQRIRARYARSRLGEFWMTLSSFAYVASIGLVWSKLWGYELGDYFAYVALGYVIYGFMSGAANESAGLLENDSRLYSNSYLDPAFSFTAHLFRHLLQLVHSIPIIIMAVILAGWPGFDVLLIFLAGLCLAVATIYPVVGVVALLAVRFKDLIQGFHLLFQILFLVTPVIWQMDRLQEELRGLVLLNPFAAYLNITRDVLLQLPIYPEAYVIAMAWAVASWIAYFYTRRKLLRVFTLWQ